MAGNAHVQLKVTNAGSDKSTSIKEVSAQKTSNPIRDPKRVITKKNV